MDAINDELFKVGKIGHADGLIKAELSINPYSAIFKGHFPGQPVVPGACMLQIVKEVLESALGQSLLIKKAGNLKFIGMIDPLVTTSVQLEIAYKFVEDGVSVTGKLSDGDRVCFKCSAIAGVLKLF
ncbi:MAG: 3-hydroxyacyl-ACP dehydratase [Bacteroidota bacterium]|nr:3-hydroxyacyl-ACP dehydratase [Bacteroidota bacterium]